MGVSPYTSWEDALWSRVDTSSDGCWLWQGPIAHDGYGRVNRFEDGKAKWQRAHRLAWKSVHGDPGDLGVLHRCDTPLCCNPAHLFLGTQADNMADMRHKQRGAKGEVHGHARLTKDQVLAIRRLAGQATQSEIGARFGISREHARDIIKRKKWAHV